MSQLQSSALARVKPWAKLAVTAKARELKVEQPAHVCDLAPGSGRSIGPEALSRRPGPG